jgi:hypothetical protein
MGTPAAILVGAVVIAASIAVSLHYSIAVGPTRTGGAALGGGPDYDRPGVYRLDRWTGEVVWCGQQLLPSPVSASRFTCEVK